MKWYCFNCKKEFDLPIKVNISSDGQSAYLYKCPFCNSMDVDKFDNEIITGSNCYDCFNEHINSYNEDFENFEEGEEEEEEELNPLLLKDYESIPEHPNCPCHIPVIKPTNNYIRGDWNLKLTEDDKEEHEFMLLTLDPLIKKLIVPIDYYDEMNNRFVKTFDKDAGVPVGKRNS